MILLAVVLLLVVAGLAVDRLSAGSGTNWAYCGRFVGVIAERHDYSGPPCDDVRAQRLLLIGRLGGGAVLLAVAGGWISRRHRDPSENYRRY